jgi:hypothetical protein
LPRSSDDLGGELIVANRLLPEPRYIERVHRHQSARSRGRVRARRGGPRVPRKHPAGVGKFGALEERRQRGLHAISDVAWLCFREQGSRPALDLAAHGDDALLGSGDDLECGRLREAGTGAAGGQKLAKCLFDDAIEFQQTLHFPL